MDIGALLRDGEGRWVLDPASSRADFHVKHFWGAMTVRGRFERIAGEGTVEPRGTVSGHLRIEAMSLSTNNRRRDEHLRSADFFDVTHHPELLVDASADSVVLNAEVVVDRTRFSMTWSPLGIASRRARLVVVARFVRH